MDFIALDIQTANKDKGSICFIKILVVKNNEIKEILEYLIKPKNLEFDEFSTYIHGIKRRDVKDKKEFIEIWEEIKNYFNKTTIAIYNSSIKIETLKEVFKAYNIKNPNFKFICTSKLFRKIHNSNKLNTLSEINDIFKIKKENNKIDESMISFKILVSAIEKVNISSINSITEKIGIKVGELGEDYYKPCLLVGIKSEKNIEVKNIIDSTNFKISEINNNINKKSFINEVVVFTRGLTSMKRYEAMEQVRKFGGITSGTVNKKVTTLVVGVKDIDSLNIREMSTKHRKAIQLKEKGQSILILNEEQFLEKLNKIRLNL